MRTLLAIAAIALAAPATAQEEEAPVTPTSVVAAASAEEWVTIAPEDLLVMELAPDAAGRARTVVIQLMPPPFSQPWVTNIRTLARAHWWDGTSVNRVQDNYVTQWGDVTEEKELPEGVTAPETSFTSAPTDIFSSRDELISAFLAGAIAGGLDPDNLPDGEFDADAMFLKDRYAPATVWVGGWPIGLGVEAAWPIHCYGYVGVGRGYAPDTGTGADLYTIIGQPQRHMDRNLAVVGRIIEGMEHMSSLPRGSGDLGFYTEDEADLRTPILSVRLASDLENPPSFEYLNTSSESFARYVAVRANRNDAFYTVPAGGVDVCSVQVPVRRVSE